MDDLSFLEHAKKGEFIVIINAPDGKVIKIDTLDAEVIRAQCPAMTRVSMREGNGMSYTFDSKSVEAVISLLRHIYLEDYTYCEAGLERPCSLHFHLQMLQLALMLEMTALQNTVRFYILEETERFHETKAPVHDFYEGVVYLYTELRDCKDIREIIAGYCVNRFAHFRFYEKEIFRQTAFESPMFHKDLQHANVRAEFDNPAAIEIVQLPVCGHWIHSLNVDFACQHHSPTTENNGAATPTRESMSGIVNERKQVLEIQTQQQPGDKTPPGGLHDTLVLRPKQPPAAPQDPSYPFMSEESFSIGSKYWRDTQQAMRDMHPTRMSSHRTDLTDRSREYDPRSYDYWLGTQEHARRDVERTAARQRHKLDMHHAARQPQQVQTAPQDYWPLSITQQVRGFQQQRQGDPRSLDFWTAALPEVRRNPSPGELTNRLWDVFGDVDERNDNNNNHHQAHPVLPAPSTDSISVISSQEVGDHDAHSTVSTDDEWTKVGNGGRGVDSGGVAANANAKGKEKGKGKAQWMLGGDEEPSRGNGSREEDEWSVISSP